MIGASHALIRAFSDTRHIRYVVSIYLFRTILFTLIALAIVLALDAATHLSRIVEGQGGAAQPNWVISGYYLGLRALYVLPSLVPVAAFAGPLWAEHSLAGSLERLMISNSGRSSFQALLPALIFGTLLGVTQFFLLAGVRPAVSQAQGVAHFRYFGPYYETPHVSQPTWIALGDEMVHARIRFEAEGVTLEDVQLYQLAGNSTVSLVVAAHAATPDGNGVWIFRSGTLWDTTDRSGPPQAMQATPYTVFRRSLNLDPLWLAHSRVPPDLLPQVLLERFAHNPSVSQRFGYEAALQQRYAATPGAIGMALLAGALSMLLFGPQSAPRRVLLCAIAGGSAYVLLIAIPMMGASGAAPAGVTAWLVPILFIMLALSSPMWSALKERFTMRFAA